MIKTGKSTISLIIISITAALIFLWVYAAMSKLINYEQSLGEMLSQPMAPWLEKILAWAVPLTELIAATMLIYKQTKFYGLLLSCLLLISFSVYIALVMNSVFNRIPCSCGGLLKNMSWEVHLIFNLLFLALAVYALFYTIKERRNMGKDF